MTPLQFKDTWTKEDNSLNPLSVDRCKGLNLKQSTIDFLIIAGLPDNVSPYLSFIKDTDDLYYGINRLTKQYDVLEKEFEKYIVIGFDGSGNPIAINTGLNDRIEWLDHEDYFSARYVNNSIHELAATLIAYRDFVSRIQRENGEDAFLDSNFTDIQFKELEQKIKVIDSKSLTEDGFWKEELAMLLANRQYYLSNPQ